MFIVYLHSNNRYNNRYILFWLTDVLGAAALLESLGKRHVVETIHLGLVTRGGLGPTHQAVMKIVASWRKVMKIYLYTT